VQGGACEERGAIFAAECLDRIEAVYQECLVRIPPLGSSSAIAEWKVQLNSG
jgi:hypothetical protein